MRFKIFLRENLKDKISEDELDLLPSGFQRIGEIIIVHLDRKLWKREREIGNIILREFHAKSVFRKGSVSGELRLPELRRIAGKGSTATVRENGCIYRLDVSKVMFSKGNVLERGRIRPGRNETVVDMFAGIGYFSLPMAKTAGRVIAIEKSPEAMKFLRENIRLNRAHNIVPILGDCRKLKTLPINTLEGGADRIVMGYFPGTEKFLPAAFGFIGLTGTIHYHNIYQKGDLWKKPVGELKSAAERAGFSVVKIDKHIVKQFSPAKYHVVIDARVSRRHPNKSKK